jgi:hypothetical protein
LWSHLRRFGHDLSLLEDNQMSASVGDEAPVDTRMGREKVLEEKLGSPTRFFCFSSRSSLGRSADTGTHGSLRRAAEGDAFAGPPRASIDDPARSG